jgi:importin subunit beta-1
MAAGTCLSLLANCVGDEIVRHVLPFVEQNVRNPNWKFREASVMALGEFFLPFLLSLSLF